MKYDKKKAAASDPNASIPADRSYNEEIVFRVEKTGFVLYLLSIA